MLEEKLEDLKDKAYFKTKSLISKNLLVHINTPFTKKEQENLWTISWDIGEGIDSEEIDIVEEIYQHLSYQFPEYSEEGE